MVFVLYEPLPTAPFPPDIKRAHRRISHIKRRTPQAPDPVHHATLTVTPANLGRHVHKTLDLPLEIPVGYIPTILAPLARKDAFLRRVDRHRRDGRFSDQGESQTLIEIGTLPDTGGEQLVLHGRVDHPDDGLPMQNHGDGDAEHGEEMCVVHGAVQGVDDPCWMLGGDEIVSGRVAGIRLFSQKSALLGLVLEVRYPGFFSRG